MNKREKAIWNVSIFISIIVLGSFIYSLWDTQSALNTKKKNFISTLKKFEEYGIPSSVLLTSILNDNNISIKKNTNIKNKEKTVSNEKEFIEYKEVVSKKKDLKAVKEKNPFTSITGFSVKGNEKWDEGENFKDTNNNGQYDKQELFTDREEKIKPGCYLLTEINGKRFKKGTCLNYSLEIDEISNDDLKTFSIFVIVFELQSNISMSPLITFN